MSVRGVRRWGVGIGLVGGAAVPVAMLGIAAAHADDSTDAINGWTVTPTGDSASPLLPATLSDPSNSLGLGADPIAGSFGSVAATPLSSIGVNESFTTALSTAGTSDNLIIQDNWFSGFEIASVQAGQDNAVMSLLVPDASGNQVVDLFNFGTPDPAPLFNPDATGPIEVGGVDLASPDAGALFNDLGDALFTGNTTAWSNATTLLDGLFGIDPSGAADAVDPSGLLPDLGF
ncbi:hypothetical protein KIH27_21480 [Mycobacterium sp. M1]|uniref:Uncharacterized protein n=1 Tax=Mycolicibacter acidiphilus TaxID=2835306 RepID=A0ABS5RPN6_9MYCO|nr:hypothetical protein [Mycolicibacter acidiphilus]MBS9536159.1 hypothetical protein [Mycolicibacter acidiphilus]UVO11489.1 hypothetical protein NM962_16160 [Mycobacterium sp. SVM_VP21]